MRINNVYIYIYIYIYSGFEERISGVLLGSIVGPIILFNAFLNYFFHGIENVSVHNFADDNTLPCFGQTVKDLTQQTFIGLQDVLKMSSRNVLKTKNCYAEDVLKTS